MFVRVYYLYISNFYMKKENIKRNVLITASTIWMLSPFIVFGQNFTWLTTIINGVDSLVILAVPVLLGIGLAFFIWGLVVFIANSGNEQAREVGKQKMIWGVVALFVIVSVWGLVRLLQTITGVTGSAGSLTAPTVL